MFSDQQVYQILLLFSKDEVCTNICFLTYIMNCPGCGKGEMIKTLAKAQNLFTEKTTLNFLNPKSVTRDELYGSINVSTREWMDGLISQIFRDLANCFTVKHEYIILDGDIDAEWIESMNTVI